MLRPQLSPSSLCHRLRSHAAAKDLAAAAALDSSLVVVAADLAATDLAATAPRRAGCHAGVGRVVPSRAVHARGILHPAVLAGGARHAGAGALPGWGAKAPLAAAAVASAADVSVDITDADCAAVVLVAAAALP